MMVLTCIAHHTHVPPVTPPLRLLCHLIMLRGRDGAHAEV